MTSVETQNQKIQSLQHSVLFLQQQHTSTLSDLYKEIQALQNKCTALTFQLTQYQLSKKNEEEDSSESSFRDTLQSDLNKMRLDNTKLKALIETKDKRIVLLEGQLKSREQKYNDDLKNVQRKIAELQLDLESKSSSIAYLTMQMQNKRKQKVKENEDIASLNVKRSPSSPTDSPTQRCEHHMRRSVTSPAANVTGLIQESSSHQLITSDYVLQNSLPKNSSKRFSTRYKQSVGNPPRPAIGHSHMKRERDLRFGTRPAPVDYEEIIKLSQSNDIIASKSSVFEPLPPITTRSGRQLRDPLKVRSRVLRSNKATANSSGEVEEIIIETKLTSPEKSFRKLQNSSSK